MPGQPVGLAGPRLCRRGTHRSAERVSGFDCYTTQLRRSRGAATSAVSAAGLRRHGEGVRSRHQYTFEAARAAISPSSSLDPRSRHRRRFGRIVAGDPHELFRPRAMSAIYPAAAWVARAAKNQLNSDPAEWEKQQIAGWHSIRECRPGKGRAEYAGRQAYGPSARRRNRRPILGVEEPYRLRTNLGVHAPLIGYIEKGTVRRVLFIMVNAQVFPRLTIRSAAGAAEHVVHGFWARSIPRRRAGPPAVPRGLKKLWVDAESLCGPRRGVQRALFGPIIRAGGEEHHLIEVDFDAIHEPKLPPRSTAFDQAGP